MGSNKKITRPLAGRSRRWGGAVMEAAIVLPVMTMLAMGAVQYGYAMYLKHALQQAASAAARVAVMPSATDTQVQTAFHNQMTATGFGSISATAVSSPTSINAVTTGTYVTVTVSASWSNVGINPLPACFGGFSSSKTFSAAATLLHE
jgi:Flp pilus assembly protein TadG